MEEYLITARSVTQAQRMAQLLERRGVCVPWWAVCPWA